MWKFLTFETFVTQDILIIVYYIGVLFLPVLLWIFREKVKNLLHSYQSDNKLIILILLLIIFLMMQLMWRMMFEVMIGYFDIHNYLQILSDTK